MELDRNSFLISYDSQPSQQKLQRSLGFYDGLCIIVCIMIGSGIFASPGTAVDNAGSIGAAIIMWCIAGLIVLIASVCYIELAVIMPGVGGDFVYLSKAFGKVASFSFAWYYFWIAKPGTQAMVASVFGSYIVTIFTGLNNADESSTESKIAAVLLIVLFTFLNCFGIMEAVVVVRFFTFMKFVLVGTVLISTIVYLSSNPVNEDLYPLHAFDGTNRFGFGQSLMACLWAFEGWADLNFLSEELLHYEKRVGPICISAIIIVTSCFVLINVCYFCVLDKSKVIHSDAVAIDFGREISPNSSLPTFFALAVAISAAGAANSLIMTGGRAFYAIAQARQAPMMMARLNYAGVPAMSLTAQAIWSIVLILLPGSSFETLLQYMGPASWLFYALSCCAVIRLRVIEPKLQRSFRVPFYPLPPLIIVGVASFLLIDTLSREPFFTFLSLGFIALSFPVWWLLNYFKLFPSEDDNSNLTTSLLMPNPRTLSSGFF